MDQVKVGRFIAECRKKQNLTQSELAEKLNITDRAISKWENGKSLPDSSIMLELCDILKINVNELLSGERLDMKNYEKKLEENLIEMKKREEDLNKKLMLSMWVLLIVAVAGYALSLGLAINLLGEGPVLATIIIIATILLFIIACFAIKLEQKAGYYECKHCHTRYVGGYMQVFMSMHMGTTRYMKCPECKKWSWSKKYMTKE